MFSIKNYYTVNFLLEYSQNNIKTSKLVDDIFCIELNILKRHK